MGLNSRCVSIEEETQLLNIGPVELTLSYPLLVNLLLLKQCQCLYIYRLMEAILNFLRIYINVSIG